MFLCSVAVVMLVLYHIVLCRRYTRGMRFGLFTAPTIAMILPIVAAAQSLGGLGDTSGSAFSLSVNPQYPAPYSQAVISLLSSSIDLANATMTVSAGGKSIYQGSVQPVAATLGKAGVVTNASGNG